MMSPLHYVYVNEVTFGKDPKDGSWLPEEPTVARELDLSAPPPKSWGRERLGMKFSH